MKTSHGLCLDCLPGWGRKAGLTEAMIEAIRVSVTQESNP